MYLVMMMRVGFIRLRNKGAAVVMLKEGHINHKRVAGEKKKVTFLVGTAFGRGWCDFGPLDEDGSDYQIFRDDDEDDVGDDDSDDDGEEDDDNWHIIKITRSGTGIRDDEEKKKKRAQKKQRRNENRGLMSILVKGGRIRDYTNPEGDSEKEAQLSFLIGTAYGRGICEDLGPLEDDGPLAILENYDSD